MYCTRPITLEKIYQTALDVRLTQNVRSTSDVEVYFRVASSAIRS